MDNLFNFYIDSVLVTSVFILFAVLIRCVLKKVPCSQVLLIWLFLLLRILFPVSLNIDNNFLNYEITSPIETTITEGTNQSVQFISEDDSNIKEQDKAISINWYLILQLLWLGGMIFFWIYYVIKMLNIKKKIKKCSKLEGYSNVWMWDDHTGACVIGMVHPKIYVPVGCSGETLGYVIKHEQEHISHLDYILVFAYYVALSINWFNPLVWIVYKMVIEDIEKACDERVLIDSTVNERKAYARTMIDFLRMPSTNSIFIGFGSSNIKKRIENIGQRKRKYGIISLALAALFGISLVICSVVHVAKEPSAQSIDFANEKIGASIPNVVYSNLKKCIGYDYHGVFVYDFDKKSLIDYISFEKIGFSSNVQGDDATFVFSSNDGENIYITNYKKMYLYNSKSQKGNMTEYSSDGLNENQMDSMEYSEDVKDNAVSPIYVLNNDAVLYWIYDGKDGRYSDLKLIIEKNEEVKEYEVFK